MIAPLDPTPIPDSVRSRLRYSRIASDRLTLERFPDFLIVGPQRTGTTWMHAILRNHPEVFLTDPKEIFYFSRLKERGTPRFESAELDWYLNHFHDPWPRWFYKQARTLARFGRLYRPTIRGEATASYAAMDRDLIEEVATLRSDMKILFSVRHPVDRAWSHAKKDLVRNRGRRSEDVSDTEWHEFFRDPYQIRCARYEQNITAWRNCVGADNVFVGTFEQVESAPAQLLGRVTRFLGVSDNPRYVSPRLLQSTVNPTAHAGVPERFQSFLEKLLASEIAEWQRVVAANDS